jgi:hypothetical protein
MKPLGLPPVTLLEETASRGEWSPVPLESLRDRLRRDRRETLRREIHCPLAEVAIRFDADGAAWIRPGRGAKRSRREYPASSAAVTQLLDRIGLASLGANLADLVEAGCADLATAHANTLLARRAGGRIVRLRCRRRPNSARPVVEAVVSDRYAPYDDARLVGDLLSALRRTKKMPEVISAYRSTEGLRLRLTADGRPVKVGEPIRMLEARNSEVGKGSAMVIPGLYTLVCTNGMHHWSREEVFRWTHLRKRARRIALEMKEAVGPAWEQAQALRDLWSRGRDVPLPVERDEQAEPWLTELVRRLRMGHLLSKQLVEDVVAHLDHPTTSRPEHDRWSLATLTDALTLRAQREDLVERFELERAAGRLLVGALELHRQGGLPKAEA